MQQPYPIDICYQPGRVSIYAEAYEQTRWIYTDGRKLPDDPDPFFNGNFGRPLGRRHAGGRDGRLQPRDDNRARASSTATR